MQIKFLIIIFLCVTFKCNNNDKNINRDEIRRRVLDVKWSQDSLYLVVKDEKKSIMTNYRMYFYEDIVEEPIPSYNDSSRYFYPNANGVITLHKKYLSLHFNALNDTIEARIITFEGKGDDFKLRIKN